MEYGTLLISKILDSNDPSAFARLGVTESDFPTKAEKDAYKFITDYAERNRNSAPSYATVVTEIPDFYYVPEVSDAYSHLVGKIKDHAIKLALIDYVPKLNEKFNAGADGKALLDDLRKNLESIEAKTSTRDKVGTDIKADGKAFLDEYLDRKEGKSFKLWRSKFTTINEQIGGYFSGNMYTWYGRSGRGKSVFTMEEIIEAAFQGANVLVWAMEMSRFEWMARAYSTISARISETIEKVDGVDYEVGFENRSLLTGKLDADYEAGLRVFIEKLANGEILDGNITLRAADDSDFISRDIRQLESDIITTKADVVLIDPIYLMDYEQNTSRTAGGDVANTSKRIRRLAGTEKPVIHVVTQAEEVKDDIDDEGNRELRPPKRAEIKKTKAVLEDAANTFGIDSLDGEGIIEIGKGRNGGEGTQINVLYLPNYGIVEEMATGEAVAGQFTDF
ncbi:DnaB-like helicase C-terminal domain-containing protein [Bacillus sp. FSL K6-3431]|uniref:DnaB-like helicase C-terminal domain-containing protein n=1 Tax=Bacillus sp. FSL K6-3431 TaxID=2921500 RepID=UPI0030F621B9